MIGILLAAGLGTRLRPLTHVVDKVTLPVFNQPMFFYGLKTLLDSGITQIIIVSSSRNKNQLKTLLSHFPLKDKLTVKFSVQKYPRGMVDALATAKKIVGKSMVMVYPGDNICIANYSTSIKKFQQGAMAFLTKVPDPSRYGCPFYSETGKLVQIFEKPEHPQTNWVVTAPYLFDNKLFDMIKLLTHQKKQPEITDLLNLYLNSGNLKLYKTKGKWFDAGTFDSLLKAGNYVSKNQKKFFP